MGKRLVLLMFLLFVAIEAFAQTTVGVITGSVSLPAVQSVRATARGNLYRSRLSPEAASGAATQATASSGYEDVIVSAHPLNFKPKVEPLQGARIIQKNATFIPRVLPVTQGTVVEIVNADPFYHNVFTLGKGERFNIGRRPTGDVQTQKISGLGETKLFCDIHTQMNAVIMSYDTPYFVRLQPNGMYELKNLPDGMYEVRVYHPNFPMIKEQVEIKSGQTVRKDFALGN
jgi:plastocyanin